jgi:hypothetical protein
MESKLISRRWAIVMMAVFSVVLFTPQLEAQDKPKKSRGEIIVLDLEKKSITLKNKKGTEKTHTLPAEFKLRIDGEKASLSDVKKGMFAICWLDDANNVLSMRVTTPAKEEAAEEKAE